MTGLATFHDPTHPNALLAPVRFLDDQSCTRYTPPGQIESCFASSMMPHQDPESVPYVQAQRESRRWWRGLDFLALHSPTGQGPGDAISTAHLPRPVVCTLGPLKVEGDAARREIPGPHSPCQLARTYCARPVRAGTRRWVRTAEVCVASRRPSFSTMYGSWL